MVLVVFWTIGLAAHATDYYVDATQGVDANPGTSPEQAWKTLTKVSGFALAAGDRVFFQRGESWRGQLRISRSGTVAAPITFSAYGSGELPLINGAEVITAWSDAGTNLYKATVSPRVEQVFFDGVRGTQRGSVAALVAPGDWHWASNTLTVYTMGVPGFVEAASDLFTVLVNGPQHVRVENLKVVRGVYPVWVQNANYVTLEGLVVDEGAGYAGIFVTALLAGKGQHTLIERCTVTRMVGNAASTSNGNDGSGIEIYGNGFAANNQILDNVVHDNQHEGILLAETTDNLVRGNVVYNHGESGIRAGLPATARNVIEYNHCYANALTVDDRFGIDLINVGNNNTVRYNLVHSQGSLPGGPYYSGGIRFDGNDGSGTVLTESTGNTVYYNVVYDEHIGINVFSFSNVSVLNNTVVDTKLNGIAATAPAGVTPVNTVIRNNIVKPASGAVLAHVNLQGSTINNNFYWHGPLNAFVWGAQYLVYGAYRTASGMDASSITGNPLFVDAATRDYRLQETSPARDVGATLGLSADYLGTAVPQGLLPDMGAYEYFVPPPPEGEEEGEGIIEGVIEGEGVAEGEGVLEGEGMVEGEGVVEGEGIAEGEGLVEGEGVSEGEGAVEGVAEGEGVVDGEGEVDGEGVVEGVDEGEGVVDGEGNVDGEGVAEGEGELNLAYDFSASVTSGAAPLQVQFAAVQMEKSHKAVFWHWDFGDGSEATGVNVSHTYEVSGLFNVTLSVSSVDDVVVVEKQEYIAVDQTVPTVGGWGMALLMGMLVGGWLWIWKAGKLEGDH